MRRVSLMATMVTGVACAALGGCADEETSVPQACGAEPDVLTTSAGVAFVRTPGSCFEGLSDWPYEPRYLEIDGMRQAYVEEGPPDGPVFLLLHGQPSWSYLYRKMIPVLAGAGFRVIAMDHLGMGRSDKPVDIASYSYLGHNERLEVFIEELGLQDIHLFVQDWGSLIGLRVAGLHPERFAQIAVGDGALPRIPAGFQPFPPVENPDEVVDLELPFAAAPDQQIPFYDGCERLEGQGQPPSFEAWMNYAMKARSFRASEVLEAATWFDLPAEVEAAYDAPFPSRTYMAGIRVFPSLVNEVPGTTEEAWSGLLAFEKPLLTVWATNDQSELGTCEAQDRLTTTIPGAGGWPHTRLLEAGHFLQDDQGAEIARILSDLSSGSVVPLTRGSRYCEILVARSEGGVITAEVWGTQFLNECPAAAWEALDPDAIQADTGAAAIVMNGPRLWLVDAITAQRSDAPPRTTFGELPMSLLATVELGAGAGQPNSPYTARTVNRTTSYLFGAGKEIYELTDPEGGVYVMQSLSRIVDPDLDLDDLSGLAGELMLPDGWSFAARTLDQPLVARANGQAIVIQDDLGNSYQKLGEGGAGPGM